MAVTITLILWVCALVFFPGYRNNWIKTFAEVKQKEPGVVGVVLAMFIATGKAVVLAIAEANKASNQDPNDPGQRLSVALNSWQGALDFDARNDANLSAKIRYIHLDGNHVVVAYRVMPDRHDLLVLKDTVSSYPIVEGYQLTKLGRPQRRVREHHEVTFDVRLYWKDVVADNEARAISELGRQTREKRGRNLKT